MVLLKLNQLKKIKSKLFTVGWTESSPLFEWNEAIAAIDGCASQFNQINNNKMGEFFSWIPQVMLAGSVVFFYVVMAIWIWILFASEAGENGWLATIATLVLIGLFNVLNTSFDMWALFSWPKIGIYIGIGLVYAVIRVYIFGMKARKDIEERRFSSGEKYFDANGIEKNLINEYKYELKGHVFRWWFLWPVSIIHWAIQDLITDLWNWIYAQLKRVFESIFELGLK